MTYNFKGVYPSYKLNCKACKACNNFFLLECVLPFIKDEKDLTTALLSCAGISNDENEDFVIKFKNAKDFFLANCMRSA